MNRYPRVPLRRMAIIEEVDRLHEEMLEAALAPVLSINVTPSSDLDAIRADLTATLPEVARVVALHGYFIAVYATRLDLSDDPVLGNLIEIDFAAKPDRMTFDGSLAYWAKKLKLTIEQLARVEVSVLRFVLRSKLDLASLVGKVMDALTESFATAFTTGLDAVQFARQLKKTFDGITRANAETLFRTTMTEAYGERRIELIQRNASTVPFMQFIGLTDDRQTLTICKPMSGYICATLDPLWKIWTPPNHYNCRSDLSPITYLEAIRLGIAERTPSGIRLTKGPRPYGNPPKYAVNERGKKVLVQPAAGFAA